MLTPKTQTMEKLDKNSTLVRVHGPTKMELIITPAPRESKKVVVTPYAKTQLAAAKRSAAAAKSSSKKEKDRDN